MRKSSTLAARNSNYTILWQGTRLQVFINSHLWEANWGLFSLPPCYLNLWSIGCCYFAKLYKLIYRPLQVLFPYFTFLCKKIYSKVLSLFINTCLPIAYNSAFVQNYRFENTKVVMCLSCMFLFKGYPTYLFITLTLYKDKGTNLLINYLYSSYIFSKIGKVFC